MYVLLTEEKIGWYGKIHILFLAFLEAALLDVLVTISNKLVYDKFLMMVLALFYLLL